MMLGVVKPGQGITPKVDSFTVNSDGSTEIIMRDLRTNHESW